MAQQLTARPIQAHTKGEIKRLRREGQLPISLQHRGEPTLHLQTETRPLEEFIHQHGEAALLELEIDSGEKQMALVHGIQRDPITHRLLQVTLQRVVRGEPIKTHVPLVFHGVPDAVKNRTAIIQHPTEQIEIRCLPRDLPEQITVDVSQMIFGENLRVADLPKDKRYEILTPEETIIAALVSLLKQPVAEEAAPETEEAAPAATESETTA